MLPYFYLSSFGKGQTDVILDEDNSRHVVQVLRMRKGEALQLTDGKGALLTAVIADDHKKKCRVSVTKSEFSLPQSDRVAIAISPLKNASRFEWFLEKATEIGVSEIIPLLCEHTERQHLRTDRLNNILVSAMLQSQQAWLPLLHPPTPINQLIFPLTHRRFIAHCLEAPRPTVSLATAICQPAAGIAQPTANNDAMPESDGPAKSRSSLILIGPEGDFSQKEVEWALENQFLPVTLGDRRLRTETAGLVAATLLCIG